MPMRHAAGFARVAARLRARGFTVLEEPGWEDRGYQGRSLTRVSSIVPHHTVDDPPGDYPSLRVVRDGRTGVPGPLAQWGIGRTGRIRVIAAGLCNHAGRTWFPWQGNSQAVGIEAANDGVGEPWGSDLMAAYVALCQELMAEYDVPLAQVLAHKEIAKPRGRKSDVNFDMAGFRARLLLPIPPLPHDQEVELMSALTAAEHPSPYAGEKHKVALADVLLKEATENERFRKDVRAQLDGLPRLDRDLRASHDVLRATGTRIEGAIKALATLLTPKG